MARLLPLLGLLGTLTVLAGCAEQPLPPTLADSRLEASSQCVEPPVIETEALREEMVVTDVVDRWQGWSGAGDRGRCFVWEPVAAPIAKKGKKNVAKRGCCQPQSLVYARCRSKIASCRLGDTSPVQWYSCANRYGNTSRQPIAGSIMVLDGNARRKMPTGHPVYVEAVRKNGNGTWQLRISHTNYDRQCRLDLDSTVSFDPAGMTVSFHSGPWASWANELKVLGFILR